MNSEEILRRGREKELGEESKQELAGREIELEGLESERDGIRSELGEDNAPTRGQLFRDKLVGYLNLFFAVLGMFGIVMFLEYSFAIFLPKTRFSIWWQRLLAFILALAVVLIFHVLLTRSRKDAVLVKKDPRGEITIPGWLAIFAATGSIIGFVFLAAIRGFTIGSGSQSADSDFVRDLGSLASWLGATGFVLIGLALEICEGIVGAIAWAKLTWALPFLKLYRNLHKIEANITTVKIRIAQLQVFLKLRPPLEEARPVVQPQVAMAVQATPPVDQK